MSLTAEKLADHVHSILLSRRAKGKAVVLCEGDIETVKNVGVNPAMYSRLEHMPDANFYKACLPKNARALKTPVFYPCGDCNDVINIFTQLHEEIAKGTETYYVEANKIFAIIDLDLQKTVINNYPFSDSEAIFTDLYQGVDIDQTKTHNHKIFVTGLIHKEAYFLLSELQPLFNEYKNPVCYENNTLALNDLYDEIINDSTNDPDLHNNLPTALNRLQFLNLNVTTIPELCDAIHNKYQNKNDPECAKVVFLYRKAKPYWNAIKTDPKLSLNAMDFRDQLSLEIAKFYAEADNDDFHLTAILKSIYQQANPE